MAALWEITPEKVNQAVEQIKTISQPKKIILFGSYIQGKSHRNSDLDILIVCERIKKRKKGKRAHPSGFEGNRNGYGYSCGT
jgi:predicted nucleotidyltransferase